MDDNRIGMRVTLGAAALALGLGVAVGRVLPQTAAHPPKATATTLTQQTPSTAGNAVVAEAPNAPKRYMVPVSDSQPATGAKDALVTIVEWCDLPDAGCATLEPTLRDVLAKNPETVRLVFRHYPHPDVPGSALAHQFVRAAHQHAGKFWEARALLLAHKGELTMADAERYAGELGLSWKEARAAIDEHLFGTAISADRVFATMFDVHDAPALFVNGRPLGDDPKPGPLRLLVEEELKRAVELLASGVDKANLYAELTKHGTWNKPQVQ